MAILPKSKLIQLATEGKLFHDNNYKLENFKSASYDLRIGTIFKNGLIYSEEVSANQASYIEIKPSEIITMLTLEVVSIPKHCSGTVFAINRMSSKGFLILNPGHIDPGFVGPVSICAINLSNETQKLSIGDSIFTLIISELTDVISEEDAYKPSYPNITRRKYEESYLKNNFSSLSSGIFDLVKKHKESRMLLVERMYEDAKTFIKRWIGFAAIAATIMAGFYSIFPDSSIFGTNKTINTEVKEQYVDSLRIKESIINSQSDQITKLQELTISNNKQVKLRAN